MELKQLQQRLQMLSERIGNLNREKESIESQIQRIRSDAFIKEHNVNISQVVNSNDERIGWVGMISNYYERIREVGMNCKPYAEWNGRVYHMIDIKNKSTFNPLFYYDHLPAQEPTQ